jgi:MFS family permease
MPANNCPPVRYVHTFLFQENDYTITAYTKLYCDDKKVLRELIQSMLGIGACLGVLFVNFVSDLKGRKFSFIFSLLSGILATLRIGSIT